MENPWKQVPLSSYELHMSQKNVAQLQILNKIMEKQFKVCAKSSNAAVLGVAGGNGLEHCHLKKVYGIDINPQYLQACAARFQGSLDSQLELWEMDLRESFAKLPKVDLVLANLLVEYIGIEIFCEKIAEALPKHVSCVIQKVTGDLDFVSRSPYQDQLQPIGRLHSDIDKAKLTLKMREIGYSLVLSEIWALPDGKQLLRLDYQSNMKI